jgi:predicted transporter
MYKVVGIVLVFLFGILIGIGIGSNRIGQLAKAGKITEAYEILNRLEQTVNYYAEQGFKE